MFDEWKITKVWEVSSLEGEKKDTNAYFCISPVIEYRVTDGYWMVFKTEGDYISIGADGVKKYENMPFTSSDYLIEENDTQLDKEPIDGHETTLFVDERLTQVEKEEERYVLCFDDFNMYLYPSEPSHFWYDRNAEDYPIKGFERYITRECGGYPELMLDDRSDFYIRCNKCHQSTRATYELRSVIDDWNEGKKEGIVKTSAEAFLEHIHEPIKYIALDEHSVCYDDNQWDCNHIIIAIGNTFFKIMELRIEENQYDFHFQQLSNYNRKQWPYLVQATEEEKSNLLGLNASQNMMPSCA